MYRPVLVALLALSPVAAQALPVVNATGITVAVSGGTLGVGPEITYRVNPLLAVRGSATFLGISGHGDVDQYRYDGHARIHNFGGTVDLHPFLNGFRLSAGARSTSGNRIRFHGMATSPQTYGGVTFTPEQAGELNGRIVTKSVAPIVSVGYVHTTLSGFTYGIDGGVMFHGRPHLDDISATGQLGSNPSAIAERDRQLARLEDKIDGYKYYPVLQLSLGYRF
jgi:hypothetical protein